MKVKSSRLSYRKTHFHGFGLFSALIIAALLLAAPGPVAFSAGAGVVAQEDTPGAPQAVTAAFSYTNNVSYNIPDGSDSTNTGCVFWPATRYFLVNDYFTVNDLNVEFSQSHASRGQIQMKLTAPDGTTKTLMATSADTNDNYYITIDDASTNALNDGNNDTIGGTRRAVGPSTNGDLDAFTGKDAHGHWTMTICDNTFNAIGTSQLFNAATLVFDGTAYTPLPPQHQQGLPVVETYFVPWPEDQVWTAMGRIFPTSCTNYNSFRDNYDAAPRQPMVGFTSITITDANTVVTYDHWEDGYETAITFPSQSSTQVWGDGNLLNGVPPGDADDILAAGQVLVLNDVMLSSTLGSVIDYDARDKIAASQPIAVSRSVWSDGSQTLFAAADEVYPTDSWGTEFRAPVGDNANLNNLFDYSAVSIIAATDGTLVDIDKDGNGTYETTGIALSQGGTYFVDDTGTGVYRGARFRSNSGHPIQVNQMTADNCSGYESRTYPLKPLEQWDRSYYSPVGTPTTNPGAPANDDVPTTVHLYNPGTSAINVAYAFATGPETVVNIAANSGYNVQMNNGTGAHFYSVIPGTSNNVRDQFGTASYTNNNGSQNWKAGWTDSEDANPSAGLIRITGGQLRFDGTTGTDPTISRPVDLNSFSAASATLSFIIDTDNNLENDDTFDVFISNSSSGPFTSLETFSNDYSSASRSYDISSYISADTTVRFQITGGTTDSSEYWYIDNVDITFQTASSPATDVFYAVASVDSDTDGGTTGEENSTYDWGITLVPEKVMSQYLIVGWAPGDDPTFQGTNFENTAPIWLTGGHPAAIPAALGPTPMPNGPQDSFTVCVDYNGDGGPNTDPITGRQYDASTSVAPRSQLKIYKNKLVPPGTGAGTAGDDQTGTQIWVCDGSDAVITAAWGGDPNVSSRSKPGLDMGYTVRNQRAWRALKDAALQVDKNGNGLFDEGDTIRYTIQVFNTSAAIIPSLAVTDDLPVNVTYVANSTNLTNDGTPPPSSGPIADSGVTLFPLDEGGYTYTNLNAFTSFTITFDATINTGAGEPDGGIITNVAHVSDGTLTLNPEVTLPVQRPLKGAIGNYVWLDEDGDGDQDAGEAGIPNMKVELCADAACTTVLATTYTDADGGYVFPDLNPGTYYVRTTPPAGLNATYDEDGTGTANITMVTVNAGQEHMTADFGYNWSTLTETNNNTGNGAIGDRVWSDADGDGVQDPDEVGLQGVTVNLYSDPDGDGVYDTPAGTTTTDANGNYIFDNLPPGSYVVEVVSPAGYAQTGDPDGTLDNKTTSPVVLSPGDVYVNADFGYTATTAEVGNIGDTLWVDADRDGNIDAGEAALPGVTVSLIKDTNGDGVWDPDGLDNLPGTADDEPIIATDVTGADGKYLFSDVPAGAGQDYLVWVNDTENVLGDLVPTYDSNGGSAPGTGAPTGVNSNTVLGLSSVQNLTTAGNLNQDFAYAPPGHDSGEGLIGDTVWLDTNNDGNFDSGEGLEGVTVKLYAADGVTLLAVTTTNENGQYFFGGLDPNGTYVVQVAAATLPYTGLTNFVDPDGGNNSTSTVDLSLSGGINLEQDFGYRDQTNPNSISGTIWKDTDADGTLEGGEAGRFGGVTVVLKDSDGNIVATTTTDSSGNYSFSNLPDGAYTVDVTDDNNVLNGYWKSTGPSTGFDNNSQVDPYTVTVSGGENNTTADFGYYRDPAALGNFIWEDLDGDGIQDTGEPGVPGVEVTLTITWPGGAGTTTLTTTTAADGSYSFDNLLLDEDFDGVGAGEPTFSISVATPPGYAETQRDQGGNDALDSDNASGQAATTTQGAINDTYDFGFVRLGSVGNYVWLDEDGDGDQDAGEAGIPNVKVTLTGTALNGAPVSLTTYTDANGGYLFANVPPGNYTVTVDQTTLPAGLAANPTYDENGIGTPHTSSVTLLPGQEYMTADFGYNWNSPTETNTNTGNGAIGDRVWSDADGDGVQDLDEVGLQGVTVNLYSDPDGDGVYNTLASTTTTDANGNYIFDNLPPGGYVVEVVPPAGYAQTGDPDGTQDNKTSSPVVLSPGDVYVNADFGYQVTTAEVGDIGDTLWVDADRDNTLDAGETLLAGVTVSLIKDINGDGVWDPDGLDNLPGTADDESIIATDVTGADGKYLFSDVPAGAGQDYLVWVNDTEHVLGELVPTFDSNGVGTPNISAVTNLTPAGNLNQDFAYAPPGHDAGEGIIGDTIFLDRDNSGTPGTGEGLEGVKVQLYDSTGTTVLATTYTDENGNYTFGGLPAATYVVKVDPATLPAGVTNTTDPDGGTPNQSTVVLPSGGVNLTQDFGYQNTQTLNRISGTIWNDTDADGIQDGSEAGRYQGVTVVLRDSNGNVVATTTTDASGNYIFTNLPDGTFTVDITDDNNVLNGTWKTLGDQSPLSDGTSKADPYTVSVSSGQTINTVDFGYYREPAVISNFIWYDTDKDGIQDPGEAGIIGVEVTLEITYPDGTVVTLKTETDANGEYSFGNLLLDEDFDGVGTIATPGVGGGNEPAFVVKVTVPTGMSASDPNQGGDPAKDSDFDPSGVQVYPLQGKLDDTIDFGFNPGPTAVTLAAFSAEVDGQQVRVSWETLMEVNVTGFNVYRSVQADGSDRQILNLALIPSQFNPGQGGAIYEYFDATVQTDVLYYYWLEVMVSGGGSELHGPQSVVIFEASSRIYLPMLTR